MNFAEIASLRPGSPAESLARAMGPHWEAPQPNDEGRVRTDVAGKGRMRFSARIDTEGRIGHIGFFKSFPAQHVIEGLHIGMNVAEALAARPTLHLVPGEDGELPGALSYRDVTPGGDRIDARFHDGRLAGFDLTRPHALYPERPYKRADPRLTTAYDIWPTAQRVLPRTGRGPEWTQGWCHGLPPGIRSEQWPISPANGRALRHAFTLLLPVAYRAQGPALVALSVFADDAFEMLETFDRGTLETAGVAHPHCHRRVDVLGVLHAFVWLTQAEFDGALAEPPPVPPAIADRPRPEWLDRAYADCTHFAAPRGIDGELELMAGDAAQAGIGTAFPLQLMARDGDPNVGKPAREWDHENELSGYVTAHSEAGKALELRRFCGSPAHLGGTMLPAQGYPDFSPYYLEFEEDFGNFNFGCGVAQFDLQQNLFDWAC